jgi:hypothetical protein
MFIKLLARPAHQINRMISTLPRSVSEQSRQAWEANHLAKEDLDAASTQDASDSELSYVSEADSSTSRKHKLKKLTCNKDQMEHLRAIKRQAQRRLYNIQYKGSGGNAKHLQGLVDDISATLGQWPSQSRKHDGKFGSAISHRL